MKLMAVTDQSHSVRELASKIIQIKNKIDFVQIREKTKTVKEIITLLQHLEEGGVEKEKIFLNDRLDIALLMDIPNVHFPEKGLPVKRVKERFPHLTVGRSVHSFEGAKEAEVEGADYLLYGHCFETNSKRGKAPNGIEPLIEMKKNLSLPVYAIGGIKLDKVNELRELKADGIAVMSGIFSAENPLAAASQFYEVARDEK
ncbi:transcriptional regulator TenI [Neobacillus bataviensis LMG 21833]|uniref:Transcriptional regulator TenI n=1 Tax=Neobacillus bataviensis LMG 21833 TaxID=1117379 RepID=K6DT84_9BACI|nr:thiamine phosphate synthase [Neobacillus bataviensis]EKN71463.1 transcriptional regulator TenI [Neobacillus bataviensis LMG 21833]